jgi:hypothetical protein
LIQELKGLVQDKKKPLKSEAFGLRGGGERLFQLFHVHFFDDGREGELFDSLNAGIGN